MYDGFDVEDIAWSRTGLAGKITACTIVETRRATSVHYRVRRGGACTRPAFGVAGRCIEQATTTYEGITTTNKVLSLWDFSKSSGRNPTARTVKKIVREEIAGLRKRPKHW